MSAVSTEAAIEALYRAEYVNLVALARLLLDRQADAEEAVQEAFARTLARANRLRQPDELLRYVRRAVVNISRDGLRRRGTARRTAVPTSGDTEAADQRVLMTEQQREVADALRALPHRQREVVVLRYLFDCSTAETASLLDVSTGSVKTHLHRGLAALETALEATR